MSGRFVDEDHQVFGGSGGQLHVNDEHLNALDESWCWIDEYTVRELSDEHQIIIFILLFLFILIIIIIIIIILCIRIDCISCFLLEG